MTTSDVKLSEGTGSKIVACYAVTEDAETKQLQRIVHSDSAGNEIEPVTVGQDTMAASVPVAIASDQSAIPITDNSGSLTVDNAGTFAVQASIASAQTLATVTTVGTVTTITNVVHVDDNSSTLSVDDGGGSLTVDGTVAVSGTVTVGSHAVTVASGGVASGAIASGAVASGAVASGAFASGSIASGAIVDGADVSLGATADAAATAGSTGSVQAKLRLMTSQLNTLHTDSANVTAGEYETVAASQTDQALGATGATGDYLEAVLIVPGTSAAGAVSIKDGSGSAISIFAGGGTTALADLAPIYVPLAIISTGGAWKVTTGANVTAIGIGNFT